MVSLSDLDLPIVKVGDGNRLSKVWLFYFFLLKILLAKNQKLNDVLDQAVVSLLHLLELTLVVEILNKEAVVLQLASSDISTRSFQRVSDLSELAPIFSVKRICQLF